MDPSPGTLTGATSMESLSSVNSSVDNNVRTLFVSGLPMDAKPREMYLLFRAYHGYESSLLKMTAKNGKNTSPVGFVTFATRQDADEARKALQGVRFDPDCAQTLRLELARSNTKVPRPKQATPPSSQSLPILPMVGLHSLPQLAAGQQHDLLVDQMHLLDQHQLLALASMPQLSAAQQLQVLPTSIQQMQSFAASQPLFAAAAAAHQQQQAQVVAQQQAAAVQAAQAAAAAQAVQVSLASAVGASPVASATSACSTLFVANLGANVNEEELKSVFKSFSGFCRLRMHAKGGSTVAFVEYTDVRAATQAMLALQGCTLPSSDRGGLRIEYARNKMADVN